MDLAGWEQRYRAQEDTADSLPHPLLVQTVSSMPAGRALDLACGTGRNALWLAQNHWHVTAVDGSATAIEILRRRAKDLTIETHIVDLENSGFAIEPASYHLIVMCYYLQRNLLEDAKRGVAAGGSIIVVALLREPGKDNSFRVERGELRAYFDGWEILHQREDRDPWLHEVAEIVVRKPV